MNETLIESDQDVFCTDTGIIDIINEMETMQNATSKEIMEFASTFGEKAISLDVNLDQFINALENKQNDTSNNIKSSLLMIPYLIFLFNATFKIGCWLFCYWCADGGTNRRWGRGRIMCFLVNVQSSSITEVFVAYWTSMKVMMRIASTPLKKIPFSTS